MNTRLSRLARRAAAALLLLPPAPVSLAAQAIEEPITIGAVETIHSEILGEDRRILVYLPDGYDSNRNARYPVFYLLDGEAHFHHVTGIVDYLARLFYIPPMIVVGVANTDRTRDLTPAGDVMEFSIEDPLSGETLVHPVPTAGGADAFLRFLTEELAPQIESKYSTSPFRLLMGHSLGGLFAVHVATSEPESFNAYLATSASLQWDNRSILRRVRSTGANGDLAGRFLYLTIGDEEPGEMIGSLRDFAEWLEMAEPEGLRWWYRVMPEESHVSIVHRSVYDGLVTIFSDYRVNEVYLITGNLEAVEERFATASKSYGYDLKFPEQLLNEMGYIQLQMRQRPEEAVAIFRRNIELYPGSANVYDSLADALEAAGQLDEAAENRDIAVRRAEAIGDERLDLFRSKRDALRARLATAGG